MEYNGKLYGKIANKYIELGKTSEDFDSMSVSLNLIQKQITDEISRLNELKRTMLNEYLETGDPSLKEFIKGTVSQINVNLAFLINLKAISIK